MIKHDRVHERGPSDANCPTGDTETISLSTEVTGEDLGRNQESDGAPCRSLCRMDSSRNCSNKSTENQAYVDQVEQEEHGHCSWSDRGSPRRIVPTSLVQSASDSIHDT
jgi:hypothetical protein